MMSGSLVNIQTTTLSSPTSSVSLTGIDTTYNVYQCIVSGVKTATDDKDFYVKVTTSGTAQSTSNYNEVSKNLRVDTTFSNSSGSGNARWQPFSALGNASGENGNCVFWLYNFGTTEYSMVTIESSYNVYDIDLFGMQGGGFYGVAEANDGINFSLESGTNFSAGTFILNGLRT